MYRKGVKDSNVKKLCRNNWQMLQNVKMELKTKVLGVGLMIKKLTILIKI